MPVVVMPEEDLLRHRVTTPEPADLDAWWATQLAKTTADGQLAVTRELRRRLAEALDASGITARMAAVRMYPRPAAPGDQTGQGGAT